MDEAFHRHPKRRKPRNEAHFPTTSMQDSVLLPELIIEILLRVPVKPLCKFRCVSKSWLALLTSPEFVKTHLRFSANNKEYTHHMLTLNFSPVDDGVLYEYKFRDISLRSLSQESVTEAFDLDYPRKGDDSYKELSDNVCIVGSVNGMVCVSSEDKDLFLWNPSIRKYKKLPDCRPKLRRFYCWHIYGFGYDELNDDYKVVVILCMVRPENSDQVEAKIYSLKSNSWKIVDDCPSGVLLNVSGKSVNGKLHWPTTTHGRNMYKDWKIVSIDLADGKWGKVEQPFYGEGDIVLWLGVLGSDLSVFCKNEETRIDVWVMKEYGFKESWTKMFTIKYPDDPLADYGFMFFPPSFMSKNGEILVYFGLILLIYNPKDESFRYSEVINFDGWQEVDIYAESLVCPFSTKETRMQQRQLRKMLGSSQLSNEQL